MNAEKESSKSEPPRFQPFSTIATEARIEGLSRVLSEAKSERINRREHGPKRN